MNSPAAVVYDNLSDFARECLGIADEAVTKLASAERELAAKQREALVLTKVAADEADIPLTRVAGVVDRMVGTGFVKRSNRNDTVVGIRNATRVELFAILEKLASIAVCPVSSLHGDDEGEEVEKAAGKTTDGLSKSDSVWRRSLDEAAAEVGA